MLSAEDRPLALALGAAAAARVEEAAVVRPLAAEARRSRAAPATACRGRASARPGTAAAADGAGSRPSACRVIQCFCWIFVAGRARASRRAGPGRSIHHASSKRLRRSSARHFGPVVGGPVALRAGHVGEVVEPADVVDVVVELLLAHARALDVAEALEPAVVVLVEVGRPRTACSRTVKSYISSRKPSSPVQRHSRATMLGNLTVSSRVARVASFAAEPDRAVGHHLVHDACPSGCWRSPTRRAGRACGPWSARTGRARRWRTRCTRRRCRTSTGSPGQPAPRKRTFATSPAGGGYCRPWSTWRTSRSSAACVESIRFCLPQSMPACKRRSPGSESLVQREARSRSWTLRLERARRDSFVALSSSRGRVGEALVGARRRRSTASSTACP